MMAALFLTNMAFGCSALAEGEDAATPTPEVIVITPNPMPTPEPEKIERPQKVVYSYQWTQETIDMFARGYWKLDTLEEKLAFTIVSVNRFLNADKRSDGKLLFSTDGTLKGVVTKAGEFEFYDPESHLSKDNQDLAEFFLNVCMTARLTKEFTGYAVPSNALYFGKTASGEVALYANLGEAPIFTYQKSGE